MKNYRKPVNFLWAVFLIILLLPAVQNPGFCGQEKGGKDVLSRSEEGKIVTINFDKSLQLPAGFKSETTGYARHGATWQVVPDEGAPSGPNILKITDIGSPSSSQFNICWTDRIKFRDGDIEVKVRADRGRIDQGGGPMWRVKDRMNYYVARLNPLEENFRIYYVKNGRRVMIGSASAEGIKEGQWFTIRITVRGSAISGWVNGRKLVEVKDSTLEYAGGIGLWTKADAASSFDDLTARAAE